MNELVKQNGALNKVEFNQEQKDLIKRTIAPNASNDELKLFLYQCQRTGLDPLTRQIYCIHRGGKMTIQTSIDGFRVVAERSGYYAGQDEPVFTYDDKNNIVKCSVTVHKFSPNGQRYPAATGVAYWSEYAQQSPMWTKFKHTMIAKCAEALALRKAFPQDLSGIYTTDEMQQADEKTIDVQMEDVSKTMPSIEERAELIQLVYSSTLSEEKKEETIEWINAKCNNYDSYSKMKYKLEDLQPSIHEIQNPSQKDINNHVRKVAG